jgi:electron transfer flavoprotein alpha/beta subunit
MPLNPPTPVGKAWVAQLVPPFVVAMTVGVVEPIVPTAKHVFTEGQEIAVSSATPDGTVWLVQATPPLVVATMLAVEPPGEPTAKHTEVDGHEIADTVMGEL